MDIGVSETAALLREKDNILILSHTHPDGDTLGSATALCRALQALGKHARVTCEDAIPDKFDYLYRGLDAIDFKPDFYVAVDVADKRLLGEEFAQRYGERILLCVDHHPSNTKYAQYTLLDPKAAATCELIGRLIRALGVEMDAAMADGIYTGLTTDTCCFRYANVTSYTHRYAADAIEAGAHAAQINRVMFETMTRTYMELERLAMDGIRFFFDGRCAVITLTQEMYRRSGSGEDECDAIAAIPRRIEGVEIGMTLREKKNGKFKVSVRTNDSIDAAAVCRLMNGGGHARAAGGEVDGPLEEAVRTAVEAASGFIG